MAGPSPPTLGSLAFGELRAGEIVAEKYEILRVLGRGGLGVVYAAKHLLLGEDVAIKFLRADHAREARVVARFTREARSAAKIRSEHVARVLDVATTDGVPYIVMEHLGGSDLMAYLRQQGKLPVEEAALFVLQACEALAEAHSLGIVHRDLKSANIFLTHRADGSPCIKVLDFGISKILGEEDAGITTESSSLMGSPAYMSPEQVRAAGEVDQQTDVWSLGVVLRELTTGKRPFVGEGPHQLCMAVLHDTPPAPSSVVPGLPAQLDDIVRRCLQKKRADRYLTVGDLASDLVALAPPEGRVSFERVNRIVLGVPPPPASDPRAAAAAAAASGSTTLTVGGVDASAIARPSARSHGSGWGRRVAVVAVAALGVAGGLAAFRFTSPRAGAPGSAATSTDETTPAPSAARPSVTPSSTASARADDAPSVAPVESAEPIASAAVSASSAVAAAPAAAPARPARPSRPASTTTPGPKPLPEDRQ